MSDPESKKPPELDSDQHGWWMGRVFRAAFFPDDPGNEKDLMPPNAVRKWCGALEAGGYISLDDTSPVLALNDLLDKSARGLLEKSASGQEIMAEDFDKVFNNYIDLLSRVRALSQKIRVSGQALDKETGLRMENDMREDLKKELERRSRKGAPFCVAFAEVEDIDSIRDKGVVLSGLAQTFARTLRSFDDIYIMPSKSFLLSLKQTDGLDACAVLQRIRDGIREQGVPLTPDGRTSLKVNLICGVAQAEAGETVDHLLGSARSALKEAAETGGRQVILYEEVSPLVKFARRTDAD